MKRMTSFSHDSPYTMIVIYYSFAYMISDKQLLILLTFLLLIRLIVIVVLDIFSNSTDKMNMYNLRQFR